MNQKNHLHIGIGSLGLGLICWWTSSNGFNVIAANRPGPSLGGTFLAHLQKSKEYTVVCPKKGAETISLSDVKASNDPVLQQIVADNDTVLLSTCLKDYGLRDPAQLDLLATLISARLQSNASTPLTFIACENGIKSSEVEKVIAEKIDPALVGSLSSRIIFADSVVDRICNKPRIEGEKLEVATETYARWLIEGKSNEEHLRTLFPENNANAQVVSELAPYEAQKRILVNGAHLSIALFAHRANHVSIDAYLQKHEHGKATLEQLLRELQFLFLDWQNRTYKDATNPPPPITEEETAKFAEDVQGRLLGHPQLVADATTRLKADRLQEFFSDYNRKVGQDVLDYVDGQSKPLFWLPRALYIASEIIGQGKFVGC